MNILQMEDMVKGLPDQILMQEAQMPSGQIPQFLALSEVQRRQEMRQKLQAPPEATVADQILQGGIASAMPQQGPQQPPAPPQGMPQGMPPQGQPPAMMYGGGMVPSGIVKMQQGSTVPFSYEMLTPSQRARMAEVLTSLGLYPGGGLDSISFNRLPLDKREGLFAALERDSQRNAPSTQSSVSQNFSEQSVPNLGAYGRIKNFDDARLFVESGSPEQIRTAYAEALNAGDEQTANAISRIAAARGKVKQKEFIEMGKQIRPLYFQEQRDIRDQQRAAEEAKALAERQQRANYLLTGQGNVVAADTAPATAISTPPVAAPAAAPAGVAPDATAMGTPAPTGTTDQISGLPEFQRETPPAFLQELLSRLGGGTSPEVQEAIDLRRSLMEQGLPAPIDLGQFIQAAEQRQLEAKEEAKRMALANVLTSLGAGLLEGDAAAGLQQATKLAGETLREGRREARAEGQVAEQLRLQAAQQERQNIIDAIKFKSENVDAIASLISGEKKADLTNSLQAAQLLVQFENNQNNLEMELRKQGFSDEKIKRELERVALQSATRIVEGLISSGQLEVQNTSEAGSIIKRLASQLTGTSGAEDLSSDNVMNYFDLAKQNQ